MSSAAANGRRHSGGHLEPINRQRTHSSASAGSGHHRPLHTVHRLSSVSSVHVGLAASAFSINFAETERERKGSKGNLEDYSHLKGKITTPLTVTAFIAVLGSSFPHGWNTGVLNSPAGLIKEFLNTSLSTRFIEDGQVSEGLLTFVWSFTVAIYLVGGCIGAFSVGWFADKFGRKKALLIMHSSNIVGAFMFGFCQLGNSLEMIIIARFLVGIGCGAGSGLVPMYLTEIAPVNIRGAMGVLHQLGLTCGIMFSQIIGLRQILGNENGWVILLALTAAPAVVSCIVLPFMPESPRYLLVKCGDEHEAEESLRKFRGPDHDVFYDIQEMRNEQKQQQSEPEWTFVQLFKSKPHRLPLALVSVLAVAQQLSGINVVFYYSDSVFKSAGISPDNIQYATLGTGVINVIMTVISVPLMDKGGRRILLLVGMLGMFISAGIITICLNLQDAAAWLAYISVVCTITFVISFAIGLGSIPQFIGAELFKQGPRPPAMSFAGLMNWFANFLVGIGFPSMQEAMKAYSFTPFMVFLAIFGAFLWKFLPETKNKTFAEIARLLKIEDAETTPGIEMNTMQVGKRLADQGPYHKVATEDHHPHSNGGVLEIVDENDHPTRSRHKPNNRASKPIYKPAILPQDETPARNHLLAEEEDSTIEDSDNPRV